MGKNQDNNDQEQGLDQPEVEKGLSPVASIPAKNMLIIAGFVLVALFVVYNAFFSGDDKAKKEEPKISNNLEIEKPVEKAEAALPSVPSIPEPIKIEAPKVPEIQIAAPPVQIVPTIPNTVPNLPSLPDPIVEDSSGIKGTATKEERMRSTIMLSGASKDPDEAKKAEKERLEGLVVDSNFRPTKTTAEQVKATKIGDMDSTVAQGKIIDAILETAINTDLQGMVRAIVSRDIYAESGKSVLIPKGSRLVGAYSAEIKRGQRRVLLAWNRVIRPDGIDVMINSPGIDQIGRAGIEGDVDNKTFEILSNALMLSVLNVAVAKNAETFAEKQGINATIPANTTTTSSNQQTGVTTSTTTTASSTLSNQSMVQAGQTMQDAVKKALTDTLDERPTITVDQGTRLKVFVKRDLLFPSTAGGGAKIIN